MVKVQWYPGHMDKARREMQEKLKVVDVVIEVRDARIPEASRNPVLDSLSSGKPRIIVLSRRDMADEAETEKWLRQLELGGCRALAVDLQRDKNVKKKLLQAALDLTREKREKQFSRGIRPRPVRATVCGIPNVGKSTLINRIASRSQAKTEDRPGVTRTLTWIHADEKLELLDTPGVLWPKFDDEKTGSLLAVTGAINDDILDIPMIAMDGIHIIQDRYPGLLPEVYGCSREDSPPAVLRAIAAKRNLRKENDLPDTKRAAVMFLQEVRKGRIGPLTLEAADEETENLSE
ncbi:MAG: ribosome biogenesis GTPase YlqF [Solobacterium sp.]|nr:ribosome biogenesis GTPase YlqF [Solobacterium sp.]